MKKLVAILTTLAVAFAMVGTAYAAGLSSAEEKVLKKFEDELTYWVKETNGSFDKDHKTQYYNEARNALLAVDLTDAACQEFEGVVDQVHDVFVKNNCKTRTDLWGCYPEIAKIINDVGAKYYSLHVTVDDAEHYATVTWKIPGSNGSPSVVASTGSTVKQTGFSMGRTVGVVVVAVSTLVGAYVVARKKHLIAA